jgi:hypothetical protein
MTEPAELTDAEKLTALETYIKTLKGMADELRLSVTDDLGKRHVERVGAFLPDGTKLGSVTYKAGTKTAKVTDPAAAMAWCLRAHPDEIVKAINPAFLKRILDLAKTGAVGEHGYDPTSGEELPFITVVKGDPGIMVTKTPEGTARMEALAHGFARILSPASAYDPDLADRLENGAYDR